MFQSAGRQPQVDNRPAARELFAIAALLESQGANRYRVRAYRRAAFGLLLLPAEASRYLNESGELVLPWLGERLRRKLGELVRQGRMQFHDDLLAELPRPFRELLAVPGIGPRTAARLMAEAGVFSLEGLIRAAGEGRLRRLRGIGPARESQWAASAVDLLAELAELAPPASPASPAPVALTGVAAPDAPLVTAAA